MLNLISALSMTNEEILNNLHTVVSHNVIGDKQCFARYKGFRSELFIHSEVSKNPESQLLKGGVFISMNPDSSSSLDECIYYVIVNNEVSIIDYIPIFSKIKRLNPQHMFIVRYSNKFEIKSVMTYKDITVSLPVPDFQIYEFNKSDEKFELKGNDIRMLKDCFTEEIERKRNSYPVYDSTKEWLIDNIKNVDNSVLLDLYVDRLIFDGFLGFSIIKGKPSDIDLISKRADGINFIEIKEKDLPKKAKQGFGLDIPRIKDFQRIQQTTGCKYYLFVRQIDNQTDRNLIQWRYILIEDFIKNIKDQIPVEGGTGMRSINSSNPTLICGLEKFKDAK